MEKYRVRVHKKGLIVIPASIRRRFGIREGSYLELIVKDDNITLTVPKSIKDAFGVDGEKALEVARLINISRRSEVEGKIRS